MGQSVESFVGAHFAKLDALIGGLTKKTYWILWVGAIAIGLSLLAHTPPRTLFRDVGTDWWADIFRVQIAHPFTPIDLEHFKRVAQKQDDLKTLSHFDKIAFRFSIPLIGKAFHIGLASFLVLNYAAGLLFFPMLAQVANGIFRDRITAAYVTFAFALTWAGGRFFNDTWAGDGFAWACLLASIYFRHPVLIFGLVLTASFTDERALVGSAGAFLYWLNIHHGKKGRDVLIAIVAAWAAYFVLRAYLAYAFGLKTGPLGNVTMIALAHARLGIPNQVPTVFQGLWLWFAVGAIALYLSGRSVVLVGFVATLAGIVLISLLVLDIERSLGYALLLLPVAWQAGGLEQATQRAIARGCFIFGFWLIVPFNTVLRYFVWPSFQSPCCNYY
jgi:hypothetical protein